MAEGTNSAALNPTHHGEMVAIDDYVKKHGNQDWARMTLYTTGEPCPMCMSAIAWCGIPRCMGQLHREDTSIGNRADQYQCRRAGGKSD